MTGLVARGRWPDFGSELTLTRKESRRGEPRPGGTLQNRHAAKKTMQSSGSGAPAVDAADRDSAVARGAGAGRADLAADVAGRAAAEAIAVASAAGAPDGGRRRGARRHARVRRRAPIDERLAAGAPGVSAGLARDGAALEADGAPEGVSADVWRRAGRGPAGVAAVARGPGEPDEAGGAARRRARLAVTVPHAARGQRARAGANAEARLGAAAAALGRGAEAALGVGQAGPRAAVDGGLDAGVVEAALAGSTRRAPGRRRAGAARATDGRPEARLASDASAPARAVGGALLAHPVCVTAPGAGAGVARLDALVSKALELEVAPVTGPRVPATGQRLRAHHAEAVGRAAPRAGAGPARRSGGHTGSAGAHLAGVAGPASVAAAPAREGRAARLAGAVLVAAARAGAGGAGGRQRWEACVGAADERAVPGARRGAGRRSRRGRGCWRAAAVTEPGGSNKAHQQRVSHGPHVPKPCAGFTPSVKAAGSARGRAEDGAAQPRCRAVDRASVRGPRQVSWSLSATGEHRVAGPAAELSRAGPDGV